MSYDFQVDAFVSKDLSIISEHIARLHGGIVETAIQTSPFNVVWAVLGDGKIRLTAEGWLRLDALVSAISDS